MFTPPPRQSSLPPVQARQTAFMNFNDTLMARVEKTDDLKEQGRIEVIFLNRTKPAPVWVFDGPDPVVGDYVMVGFVNGQKNNPYVAGIFKNRAWTSNFILVTNEMIRIQFPTEEKDVTGDDPKKENDPKSHLRDAAKLETRGYLQIDATGIKLHAPAGLPVEIDADTVLVKDNAGAGTAKKLVREGDPVQVDTVTGQGTVTTGSSRIQST